MVVVDTINKFAVLTNYIKNSDKKYVNKSPILVSIYTSMIIGIIKKILFFFSIKILLKKEKDRDKII